MDINLPEIVDTIKDTIIGGLGGFSGICGLDHVTICSDPQSDILTKLIIAIIAGIVTRALTKLRVKRN